jgi:hypothetical protein
MVEQTELAGDSRIEAARPSDPRISSWVGEAHDVYDEHGEVSAMSETGSKRS